MTTTADGPANMTRAMLRLGVAAGWVYLLVGGLQILLRPGFDVTRHPLSVLVNGDFGWVQVANFVVTALLLMAGAIGLVRGESGRGRLVSAVLLLIYGFSLLLAGIFKADPGAGFPPGTPDTAAISTQGLVHFAIGGVGFLAFIAAALIRARVHFKSQESGRGWFALITGLVFLGAFAGIASGAGSAATVLGFYAAVILSFVWLIATFGRAVRSASGR